MSVKLPTILPAALLGAAAVLCLTTGCGTVKPKTEAAKVQAMGNAVVVGPLTYTIVETDWRDSLDGPGGPRVPQNRFLLVNLTVLNKGNHESGIPLLTLIDASGKEYRELDKGDGVPQWLGLLRNVQPTETETGRILFDVPQGSYKIRVSSGGDAETEATALVDIPFVPDTPAVKPFDSATPPGVPVK